MTPQWKASGSTTLIGSMPHKDRAKVIDLFLEECPEIPVWPQLPVYKAEQMMIQSLEGLPGIRARGDGFIIETDTPAFDLELLAFYEEYLEIESQGLEIGTSRFKMGEEAGRTFFQFLERLHGGVPGSGELRAVKGQIVGPFTLLSGLKDQNDRAALYDERLQDVVAKHLAMKAKWQISQLKSLNCPIILFLDEPALAGYGSSAFISVSRELIQQLLQDVVDAVHRAGGMVGIHICANTDWLLAFDSEIDVINFDAYHYMERFGLYQEAFSQFMSEGRTIAWGMVPTSDPADIQKEDAHSLADRWRGSIESFVSPELPLSRILSQSLFTPSCGCGSLPEPLAERVVRLNRQLGEVIRGQIV